MTKTLVIYDQETAKIRAFEDEVKALGGIITDFRYLKDKSTLQINAWIPDQGELPLNTKPKEPREQGLIYEP